MHLDICVAALLKDSAESYQRLEIPRAYTKALLDVFLMQPLIPPVDQDP